MGFCNGTLSPSLSLEGSNIMANDHLIFSKVPSHIQVTPKGKNGCFIGFKSKNSSSRHVVSLGKLKSIKFMSIFRFKIWWSTLWVGKNGSDVELETQMMLLDHSEYGRPYVLMIPLVEGSFSTCLQAGREDDFIDLCVDSRSTQVTGSSFNSVLYMHVGDDPFMLIKDAMKVVREHLGTFKLLEEKTRPGIIDKFGWCTWDAFYRRVDAQGVWEGVESLVQGGCPPGLVLIDDGWQTICRDGSPVSDQYDIVDTSIEDEVPRLVDFQENYKFKKYLSKRKVITQSKGMGALVEDLKSSFRTIEYVYVWHALCGHWGGVRPGVSGMPESKIIVPKMSPAIKNSMQDQAFDMVVGRGPAMVLPKMVHQLFEGMHSYLESVGIDGVKIDCIELLEMLCEEYGGRVELAKIYYNALTASIKTHLNGNGVIASMQQCNDFMLLGTEAISLGRVGDDFWTSHTQPDPEGVFWLQGCHMVHCAYNSLWIGNFIQPDWDMFQSTHPCAEFHAASRAISGGPIYISDNVGNHNFDLLKSFALPDGSILRCEYHALPTRDCLFEDPLHDGKTMLKIWNLNKYTGVIGAFNCQGGGWSRKVRKNMSFPDCIGVVTSTVTPNDVEWRNGKKPLDIDGVEAYAVYAFKTKKLEILSESEKIEVSFDEFTFELFTVSPMKVLFDKRVSFAVIGLANMLNSGGAVQSVVTDGSLHVVEVAVKGAGEMRVYASDRPKGCKVNGEEVLFVYEDGMVVIDVPWPNSSKFSMIKYYF